MATMLDNSSNTLVFVMAFVSGRDWDDCGVWNSTAKKKGRE
jgi:hypothetical protein